MTPLNEEEVKAMVDRVVELEKQYAVMDSNGRLMWVAHDSAADERMKITMQGIKDIKEELKKLGDKIENRHEVCLTRSAVCQEAILKKAKDFVSLWVGIPALIVTILVAIDKIKGWGK